MDTRNGCGEGVEVPRSAMVVYQELPSKRYPSLRDPKNTLFCGIQTTCTSQQSNKHKWEQILEPFPTQRQVGKAQTVKQPITTTLRPGS